MTRSSFSWHYCQQLFLYLRNCSRKTSKWRVRPKQQLWTKQQILHKSGDSTICGNYRPISLLPQFNKIFEKLLHDSLYCYLKDFGLLSEHQYGFRPNSSTALAVEDIYSNLLANHDKGLHTCSLFIDCSKAFDTVDHEMERNFGIRGIPLMLLKSYLTNRKQFTFVQNMASKINKITCGLPQGPALGR